MKKTILSAFMALFVITPAIFAFDGSDRNPSSVSVSPEVCQFSLSSYTGTVESNGYTKEFTVGLSCPQQTDVNATVVAYVDGDIIASKVVTVKAGKTQSDGVTIYVGWEYKGKKYKLGVQ